jgi:TolA-binding protein
LKFANGLLRQRKYDLAAEEYERFLQSNPDRADAAEARFGLANSRLYQGRYQDARHAFEEFLKGSPDDSRRLTARYRLGELSYLLGDLASARRALEAFTGSTADHAGLETAWTYLGDACFGLDDMPQARKAYERSLAVYPGGRLALRARYGLARTLARLGEAERALTMFQDLARNGGPDWVDRAWLQIGLIRKSAGQFREAVDALASLEQAAPRSKLRSEAQLQRALALVRLGRKEEAETLLRALAGNSSEPRGPRAALELATIELDNDQPEAGLTTLDEALKRFPGSSSEPALLFRSAEALQKLKRPTDAEARFLRVSTADPRDPWADDALERAARSALDRGDSSTARRLAGSFTTRFPASPLKSEVRLIEARAATLAGNPKEAAAILESLLDPGGDSPNRTEPARNPPPSWYENARYDLALAYRALGQSDRADAILASLAKGAKGAVTTDAQFLIGQAHADGGRYALAVAPLEQYLAASPDGDVADFALAHLATARLALGQVDDAWKSLANLASRFPRSQALAPTRLRLAEAALAAHQPGKAAEQFRLVADGGNSKRTTQPPANNQIAPTDPKLRIRALAGLGKALWELEKPAEAASAFAAVLDLAPDDPIAPEIALAHGRALEASRQTEAALKAYALVVERFAKSDQAAPAGIAHARLLDKAGRPADAARSFERLLGDPDRRQQLQGAGLPADALLADWGRALLDSDKPAEADRVFTRLLDEYPHSPFAATARFNLAESANLAHNHAEVVRLLAPLVEKQPRPRQSGATTASKRDSTARVPAAGSSETDPLQRLLPAVLYRLGRTHIEMKDWNSAAKTLDRLLAEFSDSPYRREALYFRAESALQQGDAATAESRFTALVDEPPSAGDPKGLIFGARMKRIQCRVALKRWKDVLEEVKTMKSALAAGDPAIAELNFAAGQALLGLARLQEAKAAFQSVVDSHAGTDLEARAQVMCGETYFHQDQFREALRIFLKVDILYDAPRWQAAALLEAGKVYERLDQWADAAETYERLLSRFPHDPAAPEARQRKAAASRRAVATQSAKKS